ncbi:MAG: DUF2336 domain-containing protein [Rhodospirillales bacterium]|nr:DUF2336 domain-containing protein [Rhodospirillales bacterium]
MNMLTGAHAALIPLITGLHDEASAPDGVNTQRVIEKLDAIFSYDSDGWVQNMIVDLVLEFFDKLPESVVQEISCNMALHDKLPLRFCLYLMDRSTEIAANMIGRTDILDQNDLMYRIQSGELQELLAVARRHDLSLDVMNALIESHRPEVYTELLKNPCVTVRQDVVRHLSESARKSPKVAWYMVAGAGDSFGVFAAGSSV